MVIYVREKISKFRVGSTYPHETWMKYTLRETAYGLMIISRVSVPLGPARLVALEEEIPKVELEDLEIKENKLVKWFSPEFITSASLASAIMLWEDNK